MLKYLLLCFSLLMPVKVSAMGNFRKFYLNNSQIIAMAPPPDGNFISEQAGRMVTNKVKPPGCTTEITRRNRCNGTTEVRETITCTTIIIKDHGRQVSQNPSSDLNLGKKDSKMLEEFMSKRS